MPDEEKMTDEEKRRKEISDSITRYYDSLTDEQVAENRAWAELVAAGLAEINWPDEDVPWVAQIDPSSTDATDSQHKKH